INSAGTSLGNDLMFTAPSIQALSFKLEGPFSLPGGVFQLRFTNLSGLSFTVLASTNLSLGSSNWTVLGTPTEAPPGYYQFNDLPTTNNGTRFYRVRSP